MTAGYYIGGGLWVCWLHALYDAAIWPMIVATKQAIKALPKGSAIPQ